MTRKYDAVALGELLIDFTQHGMSEQGNPVFEANPGGAPANVLAMLKKLGKNVMFIGKVGLDCFGYQLENALIEQGISIQGLYKDNEIHTTLALVHKLANGDRDFSFYRKPGADIMLKESEIKEEFFDTKIFHLGSLSLTDDPVKSATLKALDLAKKNNCLITFDPNLRQPLWSSLDEAKEEIKRVLGICDVLKISDNEATWLTNEDDYDAGIYKILNTYSNIKLIALSMGKYGSRAYYKDIRVEVPAFVSDKTIETTGAGDTFCACLLNFVLDKGLEDLKEKDLKDMLKFGNAAASLITQKKGALRVMPDVKDILELMGEKDNDK